MKKLSILVALVALMASCDTLKIAMNSTNAQGERRVMTTSPRFFSTQGYEVKIAGGVLIQATDTLAGLIITCDAPEKGALFEVGSRMLIRLTDGQEITLKNMLDREAESYTETQVTERMQTDYGYVYSPWAPGFYATPYRVTSMVPQVYINEVNNSYAIYPISYNQVLDIISKGVEKLRIETSVINLDMPYTGGVAETFKQIGLCVMEGIKDNPQTNF